MADTSIVVGAGEIILALLIGIGGFFMWLIKRSVFGRMDRMEEDMKDLQSKPVCILMQTACQNVLAERMDKISKVTNEKIASVDEKVDQILERQTQVINRIDAHVNGHNH